MRGLVQRVRYARVAVAGSVVGRIGPGLLLLVGVTHDDDERAADRLAERAWHLRVFDDEDGVMGRSLAETHRAALVVSQFTLYGDTRRGRRPSWTAAARRERAEPLVARVAARLADLGCHVEEGRFGARMDVALENDGPVTLLLETGPG